MESEHILQAWEAKEIFDQAFRQEVADKIEWAMGEIRSNAERGFCHFLWDEEDTSFPTNLIIGFCEEIRKYGYEAALEWRRIADGHHIPFAKVSWANAIKPPVEDLKIEEFSSEEPTEEIGELEDILENYDCQEISSVSEPTIFHTAPEPKQKGWLSKLTRSTGGR